MTNRSGVRYTEEETVLHTKLIMLGTGHAMVTECYNTCFALENRGEYFLVDAGGGNGILRQLDQAGIPVKGIHHMFVTHGHTDHILGVVWMIRKIATLMGKEKYKGDFKIYCHEEAAGIIETISSLTLGKKFLRFIGERIHIHILQDGDEVSINGMQLHFFDICSEKKKQFGFQAILPDGQQLACLGDEPFHEKCMAYVKGNDWMLSEAFCLYEDRERFHPYEKKHSTALDAGRTAQELGIRNLVLYHTEDKDLKNRKRRYTKEAAEVFRGTIYVPDDLEVIEL